MSSATYYTNTTDTSWTWTRNNDVDWRLTDSSLYSYAINSELMKGAGMSAQDRHIAMKREQADNEQDVVDKWRKLS